jgi:membrane protease YdiL (CAAX protease family)
MTETSMAFVAPIDAPRWQRLLLYSPLARIVIFTLLFVGITFVLGALVHVLGWNAKNAAPVAHGVAQCLLRALPPLLAYLMLVRMVEHRAITELAPRRLLPDGALGLLAGLLLFSAVIGVMYLLGSYHVIGTNPDAPWLPALLMVGLGAGIGEEILMRGVLFRIIEEGLGTWVALIASAMFFGAAHMANPAATAWSSAAIAIEAGLLFGMLYHVTRSLAACMGVHAAWNVAQGTIYGVPVSGLKADGWLVSTRSGPDWLSGGAFGAEASVIALIVCSLCTIGLIVIASRPGSIVPCRPVQRLLRRQPAR